MLHEGGLTAVGMSRDCSSLITLAPRPPGSVIADGQLILVSPLLVVGSDAPEGKPTPRNFRNLAQRTWSSFVFFGWGFNQHHHHHLDCESALPARARCSDSYKFTQAAFHWCGVVSFVGPGIHLISPDTQIDRTT